MKLILMRHGQAGAYTSPDSQRELTQIGIKQAKLTGAYLAKHHYPNLCIVSPYIRAQQTLEHVLSQLKPQHPIQTVICPKITPDDDAKLALHSLSQIIEEQGYEKPEDTVLVVCHMPIISHLASIIDQSYESFSLAEARIFETEDMALASMGVSKEIDRIVPEV